METYKCEFTNGSQSEKIRANSYRDAYDKFLANQGLIQIPVIVFSGIMDTGEVFKDHIWGGTDEAADAKRQEMHVAAAEDAQASLSSTDMLLKELSKKQTEATQWLKAIRWSLAAILIMLAIWNIRVFG